MQVINDIDKLIEESTTALSSVVDSLQAEVFDELESEMSKLKLLKSGNIRTSVENLKTVARINTKIDLILKNPEYKKAVQEYISNFDELRNINDAYFSSLSDKFSEKDLHKEIVKLAKEQTQESLLGAVAKVNFEAPIKQIFADAVIGSIGLKDLKNQLKLNILGDANVESKALRYITQQATDLMFQYSANYQKVISDDLGFNLFLYQGAKQTTSRCFCIERVGKKYTKEEVEKWGETPSLWTSCKTKKYKGGGMIPATNKESIFIYRGGYNCKHLILPIG
jgi:hypothetical protein